MRRPTSAYTYERIDMYEVTEQKEIDNIFKQFNMFIHTTGTCSQSYNKITALKELFPHATMIKVLYL